MQSTETKTLTPRQFADEFGCNVHSVLAWIHSGALPAANMAANRLGRPRFKILRDDAECFWRSRMVKPMPLPARRPRTQGDLDAWLGFNPA